MFVLNGKKIDPAFPFNTEDGTQYPASWPLHATEDDMAEIGMTVVEDPVWPNEEFYHVSQNEDGSLNIAPRSPEEIWERIKARRDILSEGGCKVGAHWFHNDVKSRTQWERMSNKAEKLLADGAQLSDPYVVDGTQQLWKKMGGTGFVPLTLGFIQEVVAAFEVQESRVFKAAERHNALMRAAAKPHEYSYHDGWPQVYADTLVVQE